MIWTTTEFRHASLVLLALGAFSVLGAEPLRYRGQAGERHHFVIRTRFELPLVGRQTNTLTIDDTVAEVSADGTELNQRIRRTREGRPELVVATRVRVNPRGDVLSLSGKAATPEASFLAGTTALLLPALPDRVVQPGAHWSARKTFHLPPVSGAPVKLPSRVEVQVDYRLSALGERDGVPTARLEYEARELPGAGAVLRYTGECTVDSRSGRPLSGWIEGGASVPVGGFLPSLKASFTIELAVSEASIPPKQSRRTGASGEGEITLLGVR